MRSFVLRNLFRSAFSNNFPPLIATLRPNINHPIRLRDQLEIMLDHNHRVSSINQTLHHFHQAFHIRHVQPNCRFFQNE